MAKLQAKCPECSALISTSNSALAGKIAKCPKCGGTVRFPKSANEPDDEAVEEKPRAKSPQRDDVDEDDAPSRKPRRIQKDDAESDHDEHVRRSKKKSKRRPERKRPVALIVGGAVALLLVVGVVIFLLASGSSLRGEAEIKELIKAKTDAENETDPAKKLEASVKVLAIMLKIEQLNLTEEERSKLMAKYKGKLDAAGLSIAQLEAKDKKNSDRKQQPIVEQQTGAAADFKMDATALATEIQSDPKATAAKYDGKRMDLAGIIEYVGPYSSIPKERILGLKGTGEKDVHCDVVEPMRMPGQYSYGQRVRLKGVAKRFGDSLQIERCEILELGAFSPLRTSVEEVAKDFLKDGDAAKHKYGKRTVLMTGKIAALQPDPGVNTYTVVHLEGSGGVPLEFSDDLKDQGVKAFVGKTVTVVGRVWEYDESKKVIKCEHVEFMTK